jgi:hypothetical protein
VNVTRRRPEGPQEVFGQERLALVRGLALGVAVSCGVLGVGWRASHFSRPARHVAASVDARTKAMVLP